MCLEIAQCCGSQASHASEDAPQLHLVGAKTSLETIVNEAVTPRAPKRFDAIWRQSVIFFVFA